MSQTSVLILGGGLAGLAAAVALRNNNCHVTLVEAANRLGGRATSFTDPATGKRIDNCQHVVMRCCTNLIDFYRTLGVDHLIEWHDRYFFADHAGGIHTLGIASLPAPLHFAPSMMRMHAFSWRDRASIANGMRYVLSASLDVHHDETFTDFLLRAGQSRVLINRFWNVVIVSACNLGCDHVQAATALFVFQHGFLANRRAVQLGLPRCPLVDLYDPAHEFVNDLRLGSRVVSVSGDDQINSVTLDDNSTLSADHYVCALPMHATGSIFPNDLLARDSRLRMAAGLRYSPILGVHLRFDHAVSSLPYVAMLDAPTQWFFFKEAGARVHAVISAADDWMARTPGEIIDAVLADLQTVAPSATRNALTVTNVIKEKRATFAPVPNHGRYRPGVTGPIANLFMAGDYTDPDWPATMEAAVRSGYRAASAILGRNLVQPALPDAPLYRLLKHVPAI